LFLSTGFGAGFVGPKAVLRLLPVRVAKSDYRLSS